MVLLGTSGIVISEMREAERYRAGVARWFAVGVPVLNPFDA